MTIYLVLGTEGGIPQHYWAYTNRRDAELRAREMAKSYHLPLTGDDRWHDDEADVYLECITVNEKWK